MFVTGKNLRLYYWQNKNSGGCIVNIPEIEKEEYGYEVQPGQTLFAIRYDKTNLESYFRCKVLDVNDEGILISSFIPERTKILVPWIKEFPVPASSSKKVMCDLYIEPCEHLFEKNRLVDILKGNIKSETYRNNRLIAEDGKGIWYKHGGWRSVSMHEENLKWFSKNGQLELV